MSLLTSWLQLAFLFLAPLGIMALIGFVCYGVGRWLDKKCQSAHLIAQQIMVPVVCSALILEFPWSLMGLGTLIVICGFGTWAEQATCPAPQNAERVFIRLALSTVCRVALCLILSFGFYPLFDGVPTRIVAPLPSFYGAMLGMFLSPSIIPIFLWLWKSSQLRPGLDTPLAPEESH